MDLSEKVATVRASIEYQLQELDRIGQPYNSDIKVLLVVDHSRPLEKINGFQVSSVFEAEQISSHITDKSRVIDKMSDENAPIYLTVFIS